jgi:hypothetical protein
MKTRHETRAKSSISPQRNAVPDANKGLVGNDKFVKGIEGIKGANAVEA